MNNNELYLTQAPVKKLLFKFSLPCVLSMLVSALYNIVDQIFLGNSSAGQAGIMATTLVFPFTVLALALALLIGDGCASLYSISLGSKDEKSVKKCVGNSIITVLIASVVLVVLGFALMQPILNLLGVGGYDFITQEYTKQYMIIILIGIPFYMLTSAMSSIIRADGAPAYSMICTVVGAIINLILDPVFIFGFKMGVQGAAIATIAGQIVSAILCIAYLRKMKLSKLTKESFKLEGKVVGTICKLGISSFITQFAIAVITIVANNVVGAIAENQTVATDAGAALGIVFKVFAIIIAFSIGVAVGGQPIIGYNYGAKRYDRVLQTIKYVLFVNVIIGVIATLLFEFAPALITSIFGQGSQFYKDYAVLSFRIYLGGMLFCCLQKAGCIVLQAINKPYKAMVLSLMRDVVFLVPGVCILGFAGDIYTMLWAGIIADVGAFIPTIIFVLIEMRKLNSLNTNTKVKRVKSPKNTNFVITIGREFGSGGKYIGQELAKRFKIKCYDNELLSKVSEEFNIDYETLKNVDEKQKSSFWFGFANNYVFSKSNEPQPVSAMDNLFIKQSKVIEDLYNSESCVIIGRCADFILKNKNNVISIFVYSSDLDFKIKRKVKLTGITEKDAKNLIKKTDKERSEYYNYFTASKWGDRTNFELMIDTSKTGVERSVDIIEQYVNSRLNTKK